MFKMFLKAATYAVLMLSATAASADFYHLMPRVTHTPVVTGPSGYMAARDTGAAPHRFEIVRLGGDVVALRLDGGRYLRAGFTRYDYLDATPGDIDAAARFTLIRSNGTASLRSELTGQYVGFNLQSGRLRAAFAERAANTTWVLQRVHVSTGEAMDDRGVLDHRWHVERFRDGRGRWITPPLSQRQRMALILHSGANRAVSVQTLCDGHDSTFRLQPPQIRFEQLENTRFPCDDVDRVMSQSMLNNLARIRRVDAGSHRLNFYDANGVMIASYVR